MSHFTNYGENLVADFLRGQGLPLPTTFDIALLTDATDDSYVEVSWVGYSRLSYDRSLNAWAGTQGTGTVSASTGTSHQTSNNLQMDFGDAADSAVITHIGVFVGSDMFCYSPLQTPMSVSDGDPVVIQPGQLAFALGAVGGMTDWLSNRMVDLIFRAQTYLWPSITYLRAYTVAPSNAGGGTEVVSGGGYARVPIPSTMATWSGTQGPGSTTASTGTSGEISNNVLISFSSPTANWGTIAAFGLGDAANAGNLLIWMPADVAKAVQGGGPAPIVNPGRGKIVIE